MALDSELLNLKSAGTYRFERDLSTISNDTTTYSNLRLVVGFSKTGPFNTPNLVTNSADFIKLYGNIDRSLEKKGSYFHRSALVALSAGPILCLNLLTLDPDEDQVQTKTFSVNMKNRNKYTTTLPLVALYNTDKFWYASEDSFLDAIDKYFDKTYINTNEKDDYEDWSNGILHFANIGRKPISVLVKKANAYNSKNYELTLNEWYGGAESVPEYLNGTSYVSDYLVEVYVVSGDFGPALKNGGKLETGTNVDYDGDGVNEALTKYVPYTSGDADGTKVTQDMVDNPYYRFTSDIVYQSYFDKDGFIRKEKESDTTDTKLTKFLNLQSVNLLAKYVGSLIPNFVDKLGRNIWIQKQINDDVDTIGLLCAEDLTLIEEVETDPNGIINESIDIIGNNIFNASLSNLDIDDYIFDVDMLSYKYSIKDTYQSFTVERTVYNDTSDSNNDCNYNPFSNEEQTFVRTFNNSSLDTDDLSDKSRHPYAWCRLYTHDDGTVTIGTNPDKCEVMYTNSTVVKKGDYAYDGPDSDATEHKIISATDNKSVMVEHTSYDKDDAVKFTEKNLDEYDEKYAYVQRDNQVIVAKDSNIVRGDYLLSHWYNGYDTDDTEQKTTLDDYDKRFSRITRVVKTSPVYMWTKNSNGKYDKDEDNKYIKVVCADKVWRTARGISNRTVVQVRTIDDVCDRLNWVCLNGFKMQSSSMPDGTNERQNEILDMLRETPEKDSTVSNLFKALIDRDYIQWRYLVDTFGLGLEEECKKVYTQLCKERESALAIINCPSQLDFKKSTDPSFVNAVGSVDVQYIAEGGNPEKNPVFLFTLPTIENGASWGAYYYPYLRISDLSAVKSVPPAAYVSNLYIQKYAKANAWSIVAGQKRGVISGNQVVGVEATLIHDNRDYLEPVGINSIIWENGVGVEVYANKTAKQTPKSALSSIHVRECCIYIQDNVESILRRYVFEYNTAQTRLEIKTLVDEFLENVKSNGGVYDYKTVMDTSNNTQEVIDNNMGVIDIYIEPVRGLEILTQRLTVMKTGGISSGSFE